MSGTTSYSFCCRNCGHLLPGGHAGENLLPHFCPVCHEGMAFDPKTGRPKTKPDNWEVLALCDDDRLRELGLERSGVAGHDPAAHKAAADAADLESARRALAELDAKKARWESKTVGEWQQELDGHVRRRDDLAAGGPTPADSDAYAAHHTNLSDARQRVKQFVADHEWTARDEAHRLKVLEGLTIHEQGGRRGGPQRLTIGAEDAAGISDRGALVK